MFGYGQTKNASIHNKDSDIGCDNRILFADRAETAHSGRSDRYNAHHQFDSAVVALV